MVSIFQLFDNGKEVKAGKKKIKIIDQSGNIKSDGGVTIKCIKGCESSATVFICCSTLKFNTEVFSSPHISRNIRGIYIHAGSLYIKKPPRQSLDSFCGQSVGGWVEEVEVLICFKLQGPSSHTGNELKDQQKKVFEKQNLYP